MARPNVAWAPAAPKTGSDDRLVRLIGTRIREARCARGISIIQLSEACEIAPDRLNMMEGGDIKPDPDEFWDISQFLAANQLLFHRRLAWSGEGQPSGRRLFFLKKRTKKTFANLHLARPASREAYP